MQSKGSNPDAPKRSTLFVTPSLFSAVIYRAKTLFRHGIALTGVCLAAFSVAHADTLCINRQEEGATGTYRYPVDSKGQAIPGYFYVPAEADVNFTLVAQDGATLHIFDDAAGTHELPVPAALQTAGQYQSNDNGSSFKVGAVHLTQGWHMLYVEYTLLALRDMAYDCYCRLWFSTGQLHDKVEAVSSEVALDDWVGTTTRTKAGTITVTKSDGETRAAGDNLTYVIDKVTSDPEGQNPVDASRASIDGDAVTDANGVANVTITWQPHSDPCGTGPVIFYVWPRITDTSQPYMATPQPVTPRPSPMPTTNASLQANQTDTPVSVQTFPTFPIRPIAIDCDPNGGGGDPGGGGPGGGGPPADPQPAKVIIVSRTNNIMKGPPYWGHDDFWKLRLVDQSGNPYHKPALLHEVFSKLLVTPDKDLHALLDSMGKMPGTEGDAHVNFAADYGGLFIDHNGGYVTRDTGGGTFWFSFSQQWIVKYTLKDLGSHKVTHCQNFTKRVQQ